MANRDIKSELIEQTIQLVDQAGGDIERVTVREIAAAAGVGVGLINYHFGSKEALLHCCAQRVVQKQTEKLEQTAREMPAGPAWDRLEGMVRRYCDLLTERPGLVRMSLLDDLRRGDFADDSIDDTMSLFLPVVAAAMGDDAREDDSRMVTHLLVHGLQAGFLRSASVRERIGADFYDPGQRESFIQLALRQIKWRSE